MGDNVGGGTGGDSTVLLRALVEEAVSDIFVVLTDPEAAGICHSEGLGASVTLSVGGRSSEEYGPPYDLNGLVLSLSDGLFEQPGPSHGGRPHQDVGPTAVVSVPHVGTFMITSRPFMPFSTRPYESLNIDLAAHKVIVAKGVIAPRASLSSVTKRFLLVDTPGPSAASFLDFQFRHRRRPMYPFEPDASLSDAVHTSS